MAAHASAALPGTTPTGVPVPVRIAYLCHDPIPSFETRTEQLVQGMSRLARHGFATTLVVPASGPARPWSERIDEIQRFYGLPAGGDFPAALWEIPARPSIRTGLGRLLQDARGAFTVRSGRWDLVYTRDLRALTLVAIAGLPVVFEAYRTDLNELRQFWLFRRLCYGRSNLLGVVVHSRHALASFRKAGIAAERLHLAYNGFDPRAAQPLRTAAEARLELGLPAGGPLVVYAGHVNARKGVTALLDLAALVPRALFLLVGAVPGSTGEREARAEVGRRGLGNVRLVQRVPPPAVGAYLQAADCLVIPPTADPLRQRSTVLPMKTFSYLAAGRPILAPDLPDVREILADGRTAVLVEPDRPREAAAALDALLADPARAARLASAARAESALYTWESRAERLAAFLRSRLDAWASRAGG